MELCQRLRNNSGGRRRHQLLKSSTVERRWDTLQVVIETNDSYSERSPGGDSRTCLPSNLIEGPAAAAPSGGLRRRSIGRERPTNSRCSSAELGNGKLLTRTRKRLGLVTIIIITQALARLNLTARLQLERQAHDQCDERVLHSMTDYSRRDQVWFRSAVGFVMCKSTEVLIPTKTQHAMLF